MEYNLTEILALDSLKIRYGISHPLNARAFKGELIALIGRNGIGKSTLLKTLTCLQPSLGGEIIIDRKNITDYSRMDLARKIGYISTEIVKVNNMTVYELVALGRFPHTNWLGKIDRKNHETIMDSIDKTGLSAFYSKPVSELSDGERQRAMIARILAQDTGIMLMDEPTAFLDIRGKYEILHLMHILSRKEEKTIIFSTHDLHLAISHSDKIWLIIENKLIEGAPEDLMIEGSFDHLFDASTVDFDPEHGTFTFRSESRGAIYVEGGEMIKRWTEKAVKRAGFSLSESKTFPYITVESATRWILSTQNNTMEFGSIYELAGYLNKEQMRPI